MASEILEKARCIRNYLVECKRRIHRHPELGMHEIETAAFVRSELKKLGVELQPIDTRVGVVGIVRGRKDAPGKVIALRADMDAMIISEPRFSWIAIDFSGVKR